MKKIFSLTLVFLGIVSLECKAQITLDSLDLPIIGDTIERGLTKKIDSLFDPTIKALGTTWDCSQLSSDDKSLKISFFSDTSYSDMSDSFPDANIIMTEDGLDNFGIVTATGFSLEGITLSGFQDVGRFDPKPILQKAPLAFGDSYRSVGNLKAKTTALGNEIEFDFLLDRTIKVINYGTVKMPDGKSYEVLVSAVTEIKVDTTITTSDTISNVDGTWDSTLYYEFYCKEFPLPLLRCAMNDSAVSEIEFIYLGEPIPVNKEIVPEYHVGIYPNPATSTINLNHSTFGSIQIMDMNGKLVHQEKLINGQSINVESLPKGFYMLHLLNPSGKLIAKEKLVIE